MHSSLPPTPATRLILPPLPLVSCVRACVARSTMEAPLDNPADRYNHFPATPLCSITWFIEGELEMVQPPPDPHMPWNRMVFVGPQTHPTVSYNPGPVRTFMVLFYPHALHALCGIDVTAWVDRWQSVEQALGPRWSGMADAVLAAPDDDTRLRILVSFLEPLWQAARPAGAGATAADWVRHLAAQAADTALGRGVRNIERRIKARTGQPMRKLRRLLRAEQSFVNARNDVLTGTVRWSDVAARGGYSDQAHLCRETREITGHSPSELARVIERDESYWIYRIWT